MLFRFRELITEHADEIAAVITAEHGKVSLKGTVLNAYQRSLAEHVAWSEPGVTHVSDTLSIN